MKISHTSISDSPPIYKGSSLQLIPRNSSRKKLKESLESFLPLFLLSTEMEAEPQTQKAETQKPETKKAETVKLPDLKHLGLIAVAMMEVLILIWKLYCYAKKYAGPLASTVDKVEGAVKAVAAPICEKYRDVPTDLLVFADGKVDEGIQQFDKRAPPLAKTTASKAKAIADIAIEKAQKVIKEARDGGLNAAVIYTVAEARHLAIQHAVKLYIKLDQLPIIHTILLITLPTAAHWSEKYNQILTHLNQKGYQLVGYVPLVPVDEITKVYKQNNPEEEIDATSQPGAERCNMK